HADGGAAALDLLLELQADQLRVRVTRPVSTETTALGAATLAGLAEGVWSTLDELADMWTPAVECTPRRSSVAADAAHAVWRRAVQRSLGWARADDGERR
ncbi:MAG TPA: FGGY-family carbohydrate kinase, partial [Acidimicrobiales bacterium]|nr:FGGY-family carbohydrate kinase [Acidimicrobiales bacterium]